MQIVYEGKNVSGYVHGISTATTNKKCRFGAQTRMFYFKIHSEDTVRAFWMTRAAGWRAEMKVVFKDFPEMAQVIKDFDSKEFGDDSFFTYQEIRRSAE